MIYFRFYKIDILFSLIDGEKRNKNIDVTTDESKNNHNKDVIIKNSRIILSGDSPIVDLNFTDKINNVVVIR